MINTRIKVLIAHHLPVPDLVPTVPTFHCFAYLDVPNPNPKLIIDDLEELRKIFDYTQEDLTRITELTLLILKE